MGFATGSQSYLGSKSYVYLFCFKGGLSLSDGRCLEGSFCWDLEIVCLKLLGRRGEILFSIIQ